MLATWTVIVGSILYQSSGGTIRSINVERGGRLRRAFAVPFTIGPRFFDVARRPVKWNRSGRGTSSSGCVH